MQGFADVAKPLYKLTEQSNRPFQWTSESDEAFQRLKEAMTHAPVLAYPTSEDPFMLDTDASNQGIGAVLSQLQDGKERVVTYYSRVLHKAERRYCVTRKELLGVRMLSTKGILLKMRCRAANAVEQQVWQWDLLSTVWVRHQMGQKTW